MTNKILKSEQGFTLVEVIVALAILMIIVFAFTQLFTTSFSGIFVAGRKSESLFNVQADMDNAINDGVITDGGSTLVVPFINTDDIVSDDGGVIERPYEYDGRTGTLVYYLP